MRGVFAKSLVCVVLTLGALWLVGPREPAALHIDHGRIAIPDDDVDAYLAIGEARFDNIVPGTGKRIFVLK